MLAFSNDYYGFIFRATQSVEVFCAYKNSTMKNYKKYGIRMCTIRHCVIVWVLMEIPEKMLTEFIILKRGLLKRNVYMKDGRQAVA